MEKGGLQLLGDTRKKVQVSTPGSGRYLSIGGMLLGAVVLIYFGLNVYANSISNQLTKLNGSIVALEKQRDKTAESNVMNVSQQATLMTKLLGSHIYWSLALQKIGDILQSQVQLKSLSANTSKEQLSISGTAATFATVARQVSAFSNNDAIKDVSTGTMKATPTNTVDFDMDLHLVGSKFFKQTLAK